MIELYWIPCPVSQLPAGVVIGMALFDGHSSGRRVSFRALVDHFGSCGGEGCAWEEEFKDL